MEIDIWYGVVIFAVLGCTNFILGCLLLCYPPLFHWISAFKNLSRKHSFIFFALVPLCFYFANACVPEGFP